MFSLVVLAGSAVSATPQEYVVGFRPGAMCTTDLDNDGDIDMAVIVQHWDTTRVILLTNDGNGVFAVTDTLEIEVPGPYNASSGGLIAADFNGDGLPDIATPSLMDRKLSVFYSSGNLQYEPETKYGVTYQPQGTVPADVDNDGDLDVVLYCTGYLLLGVLRNDGTGNFSSQDTVVLDSPPWGVTSADLDNDGDLDLAVPNALWWLPDGPIFDSSITVCLNDGTGDFSRQEVYYSHGLEEGTILAADMNGDGASDIFVTDDLSRHSVLLNDGVGAFTRTGPFNTPDYGYESRSAVVSDFDIDGIPDVLLFDHIMEGATKKYRVIAFFNDGSGSLNGVVHLTTETRMGSIVSADFDADGYPDYAFSDAGGNTVAVVLHGGCCGLYTGGFTGNVDKDRFGKRTLSDISRLIDNVYLTHAAIPCPADGNTNGDPDGRINLDDITRLIDFVYLSHTPTAPCR
jgi:hypothetical protein